MRFAPPVQGLYSVTPIAAAAAFSLPSIVAKGSPRRNASSR